MNRTTLFRRLALHVLLGVAGLLGWGLVAPAAGYAEEERIWSAVLLATKVDNPKPPVPELAKVASKVNRLFGFNQVELLGSATKEIETDGSERRLNPTQRLWLAVKTTKDDDDYLVHAWLFKDQDSLVEVKAKLAEGCNMVIKGPQHPRGQIIVALQVLK